MEDEDIKKIYNLKLHENFIFSNELTIQRIIGGWIYKYSKATIYRDEVDWELFQMIFIPYHDEFKVYEPYDLPI